MKLVVGTRRWLGREWTHLDVDPSPLTGPDGVRHPVDVVADARRTGLADGCAEHVYSQECLEHFPWREAPLALAEWCRLVAPGGTIRVEVPDFLAACRQVLETDTLECDRAMQQLFYGGQDNDWDFHYVGWTPRMLVDGMASSGVEAVGVQRGWEVGYLRVDGRRP